MSRHSWTVPGPGMASTFRAMPQAPPSTLLSNVLLPTADGKYARKDVLMSDGKIAKIGEAKTLGETGIDCSERILGSG